MDDNQTKLLSDDEREKIIIDAIKKYQSEGITAYSKICERLNEDEIVTATNRCFSGKWNNVTTKTFMEKHGIKRK